MSEQEDTIQHANQTPQTKADEGIRTEVEVLDKLLGCNPSERQRVRIDPSTVILIRGEPGAGKTTLGLQILSANLEGLSNSEVDREVKDGTRYVFFSLEREPDDVLGFAASKHGFFASESFDQKNSKIIALGAEIMEGVIELSTNHSGMTAEEFARKCAAVYKARIDDQAAMLVAGVVGAVASRIAKRKHKTKLAQTVGNGGLPDGSRYPIVFIDSLNVLLQLLQKQKLYEDIPERLLLNAVCDGVRDLFRKSVIIFTSEYHYKDVTHRSAISESFFCDIEIALFSEPLVVPANYEPKFESPLGSNVLSLMTGSVKSIQTQSFCRVLKSRRTPNQSRRCAYDIVSGKGVEFYETYPGDGHLTLFAENARQEEIWQVLFMQDLPLLYPALRHDSFDRSSLQRTSAAQRRFRYVPPRADMYLASFDNYWINWYSELCLKSNIADVLQRELNLENILENKTILALLNDIHAELTKTRDLAQFRQGLYRQTVQYFIDISADIYGRALEKIPNTDPRLRTLRKRASKGLEDWSKAPVHTRADAVAPHRGDPNAQAKEKARALCRVIDETIKDLERLVSEQKVKTAKTGQATEKEGRSWTDHKALLSALEGIKDTASAAASLVRKETFEDFVSSLLTALARDESLEGKAGKPYTNRPCLQCLWCRGLLWQFRALFGSGANAGLAEAFQESLDEWSPRESYGAGEPSAGRPKEDFAHKLKGVVRDALFIGLRIQHDTCQRQPPASVRSEKTLDKFCFPSSPACHWKARLKDYIREFLTRHFSGEHIGDLLKDRCPDTQADKMGESLETLLVEDFFSEDLVGRSDDLETYLGECPGEPSGPHDRWLIILARLFLDVVQGPTRYRLVSPVPARGLRLFGERKSEIIAELEHHRPDVKRPIHRPERLFSLRDQNTYCSIPYDANISFLVFRRDILDHFYVDLQDRRNEARKQAYIDTIVELVDAQESAFEATFGDQGREPRKGNEQKKAYERIASRDKIEEMVEHLVEQNLRDVRPPKTWEEIIAYYLLNQEEHGPRLHFLIETQTPDTFLCMMLEFVWNCGVNLRIAPDYRIDDADNTLRGLLRAFYLLGLMFQNRIIPVNSTLDVGEFSRVYGRTDASTPSGQPDWVFARHWYSTLIEILSARKAAPDSANATGAEFLWQHPGARLDIMPIPVSFSNYAEYGEDVWHISCWGDWHLAVINGTENMELGVDLINNLMSSDRVCERAFANAAVPTVEAFYERYADTRCFNLPERKDLVLPNWTYGTLRETLFRRAKSRSQIFDYHHCMREFHSVLEYIHFAAQKAKPQKEREKLDGDVFDELHNKLQRALDNIQKFKEKAFLLA